MEKFTIEEIKNYIMSQDSLGDVLYYLNADKIKEANQKADEDDEDDEDEDWNDEPWND